MADLSISASAQSRWLPSGPKNRSGKRRSPGTCISAEADPGRTSGSYYEIGDRVNSMSLEIDQCRLEQWFSEERIATYVDNCENVDLIAELYVWNIAICGAFVGPLNVLEVAVRNSLHRELSKLFGPNWPLESVLPEGTLSSDDLSKLKLRVERKKKTEASPPDIVAALDFGFWTRLCAKDFMDSLWIPALSKAFHSPTDKVPIRRQRVAEKLDGLRAFRNRIAHHEPIIHRDLRADYQSILTVCSWIDADLPTFIEERSRCLSVIDARASLKATTTFGF